MHFRLCASETVQYFQFDEHGNMYVYEPGAGCTGKCTMVKPGDELFSNSMNSSNDKSLSKVGSEADGVSDCSQKLESCSRYISFRLDLSKFHCLFSLLFNVIKLSTMFF